MQPEDPGDFTRKLESLLDRIRRGDRDAEEELIAGCHHLVEQRVRRIRRRQFAHAAVDTDTIFQEVSIKFIGAMREGLKKNPANTLQLLGFVQPIVLHTIVDEVRKTLTKKRAIVRYGHGLTDDDLLVAKGGASADASTEARVLELIGALDSEEDRLIIGARIIFEWSYEAIAETFNLPVEDVKPRIDQIMRKLWDLLGRHESDGNP